MKEIKLTQGKIALVDDEDFEHLNKFNWHAVKNGNTFYVARKITVNGKGIKHYMHWEVTTLKFIDHKDGNGLNNQRSNLRHCTKSENNMNARKRNNTSSIFKGVYLNKEKNKWRSSIRVDGKQIHLGYFNSEIDAALSYNTKAVELFKNYAKLNTF